MAKKIFIQQTSPGDPVEVNEVTIYPVARSYRINVPGVRGGIIWNKPLPYSLRTLTEIAKYYQFPIVLASCRLLSSMRV